MVLAMADISTMHHLAVFLCYFIQADRPVKLFHEIPMYQLNSMSQAI
jgi:hypothetical protein